MYKKGIFVSHHDVELGFERKPVEYYVTFPEQGINQDTGLIFSICAHGETANSEYMLTKLNPHLASEANCLVVGLNYHGIVRDDARISFNFDWLRYARSLYGYEDNRVNTDNASKLNDFLLWAEKNNIRQLDTLFQRVFYLDLPEYYSAGFLPALDHLAILKEIMGQYHINPCRIIAYGSSYGGQIAHLLGKFAPDTFALIIDNSGFSRASLDNIVSKEILLYGDNLLRLPAYDVLLPCSYNYPWTIKDEKSPYYFSDSCRSIRSLIEEGHYFPGETKYHIFHCIADHVIAPIEEKDQVVECLKRKGYTVNYKRVTEQDLDGRVFKTYDHAMDASLIGIFDLAMVEKGQTFNKSSEQNDFTLNQTRVFNCGAKQYIFNYHDDYSMEVSIEDTITFMRGK